MAVAHDTVDVQLQEVRGQADGLAADIRTMHERCHTRFQGVEPSA